jgi:hypothetical protein
MLCKRTGNNLGPHFWDHPKEAEKVLASIKTKKIWTDAFQKVVSVVDDTQRIVRIFPEWRCYRGRNERAICAGCKRLKSWNLKTC